MKNLFSNILEAGRFIFKIYALAYFFASVLFGSEIATLAMWQATIISVVGGMVKTFSENQNNGRKQK